VVFDGGPGDEQPGCDLGVGGAAGGQVGDCGLLRGELSRRLAGARSSRCGGGHEFALTTDLRFASRERAILGQPEVGLGIIPGGGGIQRLWRHTGKARALEVLTSAEDYDADTAERYGWINRALSDRQLDAFVARLAGRLATFDRDAVSTIKATLNREAGTVPDDEVAASQERFAALAATPPIQVRTRALLGLGFQTHGPVELGTGELSGFGTHLTAPLEPSDDPV
jgi:hypothetical protein